MRTPPPTKTTVVVVGQTPPPFGGQALMIERLLEGTYGDVELRHVRMAFSKEMDEIGKFRWSKLVELVRVIAGILYARVRHRAAVLYYPPAGPDLLPVLRDIVILISTRWLFKKVIFHFHASGLSEIYEKLSPVTRFLFRKAYFHADAGIRLSEYAPEDPRRLAVLQEHVVRYGIDDPFPRPAGLPAASADPVRILFVGVLRESKGVMVLLEACRLLSRRGLSYQVSLMGTFESEAFRRQVYDFVRSHDLASRVRFLGILTGAEKSAAFAEADIFCFPTHFESEALSVVLIEALSFGLPIVATRWRGLPDLVEHGHNGFLAPVKNPAAVADNLHTLIEDPALRATMGRHGRQRYLDHYTVRQYHNRMKAVFESVAA